MLQDQLSSAIKTIFMSDLPMEMSTFLIILVSVLAPCQARLLSSSQAWELGVSYFI